MDVSDTVGKIEKTLQRDVKNMITKVVSYVTTKYDVYERGSSDHVSVEDVIKMIESQLAICKRKTCLALTASGNGCTRKPIANYDYCGTHITKHILAKRDTHNSTGMMVEVVDNSVNVKGGGKKVFIDDAFYMTDGVYIYSSGIKVGYVEKTNGGDGYILTDDPFLLGTFI
jgi:hypothetical protein